MGNRKQNKKAQNFSHELFEDLLFFFLIGTAQTIFFSGCGITFPKRHHFFLLMSSHAVDCNPASNNTSKNFARPYLAATSERSGTALLPCGIIRFYHYNRTKSRAWIQDRNWFAGEWCVHRPKPDRRPKGGQTGASVCGNS